MLDSWLNCTQPAQDSAGCVTDPKNIEIGNNMKTLKMVFIVSMWLLLSINIVCSIRSNSMFTFYFLVSSLCGTLNRQLKQHSRTALHLIAFQHMPLAYDTKPVCLQREVLRMNALHDESRMEINEHESPKKSAYAGKILNVLTACVMQDLQENSAYPCISQAGSSTQAFCAPPR